MTDEKIIHVSVGVEGQSHPSETEVKELRDKIRDISELDDYQVIVSTYDVSLAEIPALDDYADELADRIAERINAN